MDIEKNRYVYECDTCHLKKEYEVLDGKEDDPIKCPSCRLGVMERISGGDKYYN